MHLQALRVLGQSGDYGVVSRDQNELAGLDDVDALFRQVCAQGMVKQALLNAGATV